MHLYGFVANRPTMLRDALGLSWRDFFCPDKCSPADSPQFQLQYQVIPFGGICEQFQGTALAVNGVGYLSSLNSVLGLVSAGVAAGPLGVAIQGVATALGIDPYTAFGATAGDLASELVSLLGTLQGNYGGYSVCTSVKCRRCELETCWFKCKRYDWKKWKQTYPKWKKCTNGVISGTDMYPTWEAALAAVGVCLSDHVGSTEVTASCGN